MKFRSAMDDRVERVARAIKYYMRDNIDFDTRALELTDDEFSNLAKAALSAASPPTPTREEVGKVLPKWLARSPKREQLISDILALFTGADR